MFLCFKLLIMRRVEEICKIVDKFVVHILQKM